MKKVAILGSKGGTGKTSLAHALTYGAHLLGHKAILVHTDHREALKEPRPYGYEDCSNNFSEITQLIRQHEDEDGFLIVDGAGNRPHLDLWLTQSMDMVLVPVTNSAEDVRCAIQDLSRFDDQRVRIIINRFPSNHLVRKVIERYIEDLPESRIAGKLPQVGGMRVFLEDKPWTTPPTRVNNTARQLFRMVRNLMDSTQKAKASEIDLDAVADA